MSQTFRLRLGDGTILMVDHGGLSTWESDPTAAVGTRDPRKWMPLKEFLIQERAAAFRRAREEKEEAVPSSPADAVAPLELPAREEEPALIAPASEELFVPEEPPPLAAPACDPAPAAPIADEPAPIADEIDLKPLAVESMGPPPAASSPPTPVEDLPVIPLQSSEEEPVAVASEPSRSPQAPDAAVLPLADEPTTPGSSRRARASAALPDPDEPVPLSAPATAALQWLNVLGLVLSRGLTPLTRLDQGLPLFGFDDPTAPASPRRPLSSEVPLPTVSLDLDAVRSRLSGSLRGLWDRGRAGMRDLGPRLAQMVASWRPRPQASPSSLPEESTTPPLVPDAVAPLEPAVAASPSPGSAVAAPALAAAMARPAAPLSAPRPRPRQPPPVAAELPALPLVPLSEPRVVGEIYAGPGSGPFPVRLWTGRLLLTASVLAGGLLVVLHWEAWSPSASRLGWSVFQEMNDQFRWLHLARERQDVIDQASEQLPHLARDTVGLILASNRTHVLEPPAVFETAWGAAERGASTLSASETRELETLREEVVEALPPLDQERLRTFGRAHAQGAVFSFDARRGLQAYARGTRALPPERRERLQVLLGKAIAAGLES